MPQGTRRRRRCFVVRRVRKGMPIDTSVGLRALVPGTLPCGALRAVQAAGASLLPLRHQHPVSPLRRPDVRDEPRARRIDEMRKPVPEKCNYIFIRIYSARRIFAPLERKKKSACVASLFSVSVCLRPPLHQRLPSGRV